MAEMDQGIKRLLQQHAAEIIAYLVPGAIYQQTLASDLAMEHIPPKRWASFPATPFRAYAATFALRRCRFEHLYCCIQEKASDSIPLLGPLTISKMRDHELWGLSEAA